MEDAIGTDIQQVASDLTDAITPQLITQWEASEPRDWANESFAITEAATTQYCVKHGASCDLPSGDVQISDEYLKVNEPLVKTQLQKADVRLARLLDVAFGNTGE